MAEYMDVLMDRMIVISGGRHLDIKEKDGYLDVTIWSDDRLRCISIPINERDCEKPNEELKERIVVPALHRLDMETFPERREREIAAAKRLSEHVKAS